MLALVKMYKTRNQNRLFSGIMSVTETGRTIGICLLRLLLSSILPLLSSAG